MRTVDGDLIDRTGQMISATPADTDQGYYEIPVVFLVQTRTRRESKTLPGTWAPGMVNGSEVDAAKIVIRDLAGVLERSGDTDRNCDRGSVESWTLPANLDVAEQDSRAGTIVYGSDCAFLARLCEQAGVGSDEHAETARRLAAYLGRYEFDGA